MSYSQLQQQYAGLQSFLAKEKDQEKRKILMKGIQHTSNLLREFEKGIARNTNGSTNYK